MGVENSSGFCDLILCDDTLRENMPWAFDETVAQIELLFLSLTDLVLIEDNECVDGKERCSCMERRCRRVAAFRGTGSPPLVERS